jgi:arsenate reductase
MTVQIENTIKRLAQNHSPINEERKALLSKIADYISQKLQKGEVVKMNFICTENSRRSHLSQLMSAAIIAHFGLPIKTFSGGTKVSACNPRTIAALRRAGFRIADAEGENPKYPVVFEPNDEPILAYSKLYDAPENPQDSFIAIMVCGSADKNCPFIPTAERRFAVTFEDPKVADDTPREAATYDERLHEIGSQFYYLFKNITLTKI